jgi:hypothetical protein
MFRGGVRIADAELLRSRAALPELPPTDARESDDEAPSDSRTT